MENGTIPPRVTFEDHATYIGPLHFKIQIVSFAPTFNFYICESSGGGHATNKYAKIHEEVQYMNNRRHEKYQNYNNQVYRPHPSIGQEKGGSSNDMPRHNLYEKTSMLEETLT